MTYWHDSVGPSSRWFRFNSVWLLCFAFPLSCNYYSLHPCIAVVIEPSLSCLQISMAPNLLF